MCTGEPVAPATGTVQASSAFVVEIHRGSVSFHSHRRALFFTLNFKSASTVHSCFWLFDKGFCLCRADTHSVPFHLTALTLVG